ncbi:DnaD domain protein [Metabacillus niabensis]|uniref:DnaD domain protein n=1 Tax=Metabacillus niabensis TaxID=324854 RepID=UPI001F44A1A3|nr:DnaD domain protein [Metabacillus niabensis]
MAKYRMIRTNFWNNPIVEEEMIPEEKYFYLYLLTNPRTTQIGIYRITIKQIAFSLGFPIDSVKLLMDRFIYHYKLIRYNPETRELAIKNWGKENQLKGGKPVMDCITKELKEVNDISLIQYVSESIDRQEIRNLYESFCKSGNSFNKEECDKNEEHACQGPECNEASLYLFTIRGEKEKQKEKQKENKKEKQQQKQKELSPNLDNDPNREEQSKIENHVKLQKSKHVKDIVEFWDNNGFGVSNIHAKEQLLLWLDNQSFSQPNDVILKALELSCANNKRRLNYVVGILKNWKNSSLLTVEEIEAEEQNGQYERTRQLAEAIPAGRAIPSGFTLDITAGEMGTDKRLIFMLEEENIPV